MKKIIIIILVVVFIIGIGIIVAFNLLMGDMLKMSIHAYDEHLTICIDGGGNSIILTNTNKDKVLIVDTKMMDPAKKMKKIIDDIGGTPDITIVNTHNHMDHIEGNKYFPGCRLITGDYEHDKGRKATHTTGLPDIRLQPFEEYQYTIGDELVLIKNMGQAHTYNDVIVYLTKRKILLTGDIIFADRHPVIIESAGSDAGKWIEVLQMLLKSFPGATVIPGHGDMSDESVIITLKEYFENIRNAIGDKEKIRTLRKKYNQLGGIPFMSGFDITLGHFQKKGK